MVKVINKSWHTRLSAVYTMLLGSIITLGAIKVIGWGPVYEITDRIPIIKLLPDNAQSAYIEMWSSLAVEEMRKHGIPASITLAQGMLESHNGKSRLTLISRNHFGIKCHKGWKGKTVRANDDKENECFRYYDRDEDSFADHSAFLLKPRYEELFKLEGNDYKGWAEGLSRLGYATDKHYAKKLIKLIEKYELYELDKL